MRRGVKLQRNGGSLSARRAWIEIAAYTGAPTAARSLSARRAWIEIRRAEPQAPALVQSLSARRAWIEIIAFAARRGTFAVALRKESVDRNVVDRRAFALKCVALRKESVDRNTNFGCQVCVFCVALRKESVDRNTLFLLSRPVAGCRSPQGERG